MLKCEKVEKPIDGWLVFIIAQAWVPVKAFHCNFMQCIKKTHSYHNRADIIEKCDFGEISLIEKSNFEVIENLQKQRFSTFPLAFSPNLWYNTA